MMCLRFVFLLIMRLAAWLRLSRRAETWKTAEILLLRHQLTVLQRRQPHRPDLDWAVHPADSFWPLEDLIGHYLANAKLVGRSPASARRDRI